MDAGLQPDQLRALWAEDEGASRDVYIEDTTANDWQAVLAVLLERWPCSYTEDGTPVPLPSVDEILRRRADRATHLGVQLTDALTVDVHFFEAWQIEFTFDPGHVSDDADVYRILEFVLQVGRTLGRSVHLTCESHHGSRPPDDLYYDPRADHIVYPPE